MIFTLINMIIFVNLSQYSTNIAGDISYKAEQRRIATTLLPCPEDGARECYSIIGCAFSFCLQPLSQRLHRRWQTGTSVSTRHSVSTRLRSFFFIFIPPKIISVRYLLSPTADMPEKLEGLTGKIDLPVVVKTSISNHRPSGKRKKDWLLPFLTGLYVVLEFCFIFRL